MSDELTPTPDWPEDARHGYGDRVQRKTLPSGAEPVPLWRGRVCGWYRNPVTGELGFNIASEAEPGAVQCYQQRHVVAAPLAAEAE